MPWTSTDASRFKKGLTEKQKRQWARIANSVLARCQKDGGGKNCEALAIRQASGVVGNTEVYSTYATAQDGEYDIGIKTHQKKKHLVLPVTMMVEGVHHGSGGPLFHSISELGKFPESWNGIPVVIYHPEKEGTNVSANSPDIIDLECIGRVYNTYVDGKKLKAEVWLNEEKLKEVDEDTLISINKKEPIEVSVGVFTEEEEIEGEWNEEKYEAIAINHRPDHLALLPGEIGACSLSDGCGIRVNKKGGINVKHEIGEMIESLSLAGYSVNQIGDHAKQGFKEIMDSVYSVLRSMDSESNYHYLEELYGDHLVYQVNSKDGSKLYKQNYLIEKGKVAFDGSPVEVKKKVDFVEVQNNSFVRTKFNTNKNKEVKNMSEINVCSECVKKKVNDLIAHSDGRYTEAHRQQLETLSEEILDQMAKPVIKEKEVVKEVSVLTAEQRADLDWAQKMRKEKKDTLVKSIQANSSKELWPDDELNAMSDTLLEKLEKSVKANKTESDDTDYSAQSAGNFGSNRILDNEEAPLYPTGVEVELKK